MRPYTPGKEWEECNGLERRISWVGVPPGASVGEGGGVDVWGMKWIREALTVGGCASVGEGGGGGVDLG